MALIGKFIVGFVLLILTAMLGGFVMSELWGWFVVPLGVRAIGIAHALGLMLTIHMTLAGLYLGVSTKETTFWQRIVGLAIAYLLIWGFGAIYAFFM